MACSGCGATRDADVRFFLEDDAPEVVDEAMLARARAGADWLCRFCGSSSPPTQARCRSCGAERGDAASRPVGLVMPQPAPAAAAAAPAAPLASRPSRLGRVLVLALLLVLGLCAVAGYFAFRKTEETLTVAGFEWERSVAVEAYRTVREQAWEGELPGAARVVSRKREVHHHEREQVGTHRVKVGTRDLGNGFFEDVYEERPEYRERPVYRTRLTFDVEKWVPDRTLQAKGSDHSPAWPEVVLARGEREGRRQESYVALLQGRKPYRIDLPQARWASLQSGQSVRAVIRGGSRVMSID
jgi:hypothetical protein